MKFELGLAGLILIFSLMLSTSLVFADCSPASIMTNEGVISEGISSINYEANNEFKDLSVSELHDKLMNMFSERIKHIYQAADALRSCGQDPTSYLSKMSVRAAEAINYQPIPEFGPLSGMIMLISISILIISKKFRFHL